MIFEESYYIFAVAYNPSHLIVLKADARLISVLIHLRENYDAERYARICFECLTRPVSKEDDAVAEAAEQLAEITWILMQENGLKTGDIVESEILAWKVISIR